MRTIGLIVAGALLASGPAAFAQSAAAPSPAPGDTTAQAAKPDPVVAKVGNAEIHLSDVTDAISGLPAEYRNMPAPMLFPMMLDQLVDRKAIVLLAEKQGLEKDPQVARQITRAQDSALQNALLSRTVGPMVTEAKVRQRYDQTLAGKPGEEEVHARHILLPTEDEAKKIITQLKGGRISRSSPKSTAPTRRGRRRVGISAGSRRATCCPSSPPSRSASSPARSATPRCTRSMAGT